jgi:outer membrane protein assembly factor BamB
VWSEHKNIAWKVPVPGRGFSSPVVLEGKVWLTTALEDQRSLRLLGWSASSGKLLHDIEVFRPQSWQASHFENSYASPTPVLEPGRVYVHFGTYGTAALNATDGRILWRTIEPLQIDHEVGPGSSPILYRDLLIINCDGTDRRFVAALNKHTGELAWKAPRSLQLDTKGVHKKAFSTPLVVAYQGSDQLISPGAGQVSSYDPQTGKEIWRVRYEGYSNVPRPVAGFGRVFVTTGYMKPSLLAIHLGGEGDVTETRLAWSYRWQVPANPSPLLIGNRLYMINDQGNATWLDAHGGTDLWRERLGGKHYASPIYAAGRIYNWSVEGQSVVLAADDEFQRLATNQLDGVLRATPAVSDQAFFIRTTSHLYRIENRIKNPQTP